MSTNITQRTIAALEGNGSVRFIRDSQLQGFGIKVTAKGKASYFAEARVRGGRTVRKTIGPVDLIPLDDAKNEARSLLLQLKRGVDVGKITPPPPPEANSLQSALNRYIETRTRRADKPLKASTAENYRKVLNNAFPDLLLRDVGTITKEDIAACYRDLSARTSVSYTGIALRTLRAILNASGLTVNPVKQFVSEQGVSSTSTARDRYLRNHEVAAIMEASEQSPFGELLFFYLLTGCRRGEALGLLKTDYSERDQTLTFRETKNGRPHTIPTHGWIKSIVEKGIERSGSDRIFDFGESTVRTKLKKAQEYLNFDEHWTIHDLRRTFAEHCQLGGVDVGTIATALNHSPIGITERAYLPGQLAKLENLRGAYDKLQRQYRAYFEGADSVRIPEEFDLRTL